MCRSTEQILDELEAGDALAVLAVLLDQKDLNWRDIHAQASALATIAGRRADYRTCDGCGDLVDRSELVELTDVRNKICLGCQEIAEMDGG